MNETRVDVNLTMRMNETHVDVDVSYKEDGSVSDEVVQLQVQYTRILNTTRHTFGISVWLLQLQYVCWWSVFLSQNPGESVHAYNVSWNLEWDLVDEMVVTEVYPVISNLCLSTN
jgi:hypothetical protein